MARLKIVSIYGTIGLMFYVVPQLYDRNKFLATLCLLFALTAFGFLAAENVLEMRKERNDPYK